MKSERGYTLAEMLVALLITGFVAATLGVITHEVVVLPQQGNAQVEALHTLQNAVYWLSGDVQAGRAASVNGTSLEITLPNAAAVTYALNDGVLSRTQNGQSREVARSVYSLAYTLAGRTLTVSIGVSPGSWPEVTENQTFSVAMRPAAEE